MNEDVGILLNMGIFPHVMLVNSGVYPKQPPGLPFFIAPVTNVWHKLHKPQAAPLKELKDAMTEVGAKLVEARLS